MKKKGGKGTVPWKVVIFFTIHVDDEKAVYEELLYGLRSNKMCRYHTPPFPCTRRITILHFTSQIDSGYWEYSPEWLTWANSNYSWKYGMLHWYHPSSTLYISLVTYHIIFIYITTLMMIWRCLGSVESSIKTKLVPTT